MKVAILGTKGIPNNYGGFEQCAEKLSLFFYNKYKLNVFVYNPKSHKYKSDYWNGIKIIKINDFKRLPIISSIIYDLLCIIDASKRSFDIVIQLGYSPSGLFMHILKAKNIPIITNMAGIEWKRSKWNFIAKKVIKFSEEIAVRKSNIVISDNIGIKKYIDERYSINSKYIAYGADIPISINEDLIHLYNLEKESYYLIIARLQKDNNIEIILDGYIQSEEFTNKIIVIGGIDNTYGKYLTKKYQEYRYNIIFLGGIYNQEILNSLRKFSKIYFHGHSAGGTNPSLLEAMAAESKIVAHDNIFNRSVLKRNALFFKNEIDVANIIKNFDNLYENNWVKANKESIKKDYQWEYIAEQYFKVIQNIEMKRKII